MWEDKILYWSWNGPRSPEDRCPPTTKRIVYGIFDIGVNVNGPCVGQITFSRVAIGVWDDNVFKMYCGDM